MYDTEFVMRTSFLFVAMAALAVACSDNDQPTSPNGSTRPQRTPNAAPAAVASQAPTPDLRPIDQVGFTSVVFYIGDWVTVEAGGNGTAFVACPTGTIVTGGGYDTVLNGTSPLITKSRPIGAGVPSGVGWKVAVDNSQAGAAPVKVSAWAGCAS